MLHVVRMAYDFALLEGVRHLTEVVAIERTHVADLVDWADVLVMLDVYNL